MLRFLVLKHEEASMGVDGRGWGPPIAVVGPGLVKLVEVQAYFLLTAPHHIT